MVISNGAVKIIMFSFSVQHRLCPAFQVSKAQLDIPDKILDYLMKDFVCAIDLPKPYGKFCQGYPVVSLTPEMVDRVHAKLKKKTGLFSQHHCL